MSKNNPELENLLPIEQLSLLYKQSFAAFAATIAVLAYIFFWIYGLVNSTSLYLWAGAVIALNVYLLIWIYFVNRATKAAQISSQYAKRFILIYQIQAVLHGFSWGMLPFLLAELSTPEIKFFAYIVLCGMAAGAIGTTAMIYRIYLSFMLPLMLPVILTQLFFQYNFELFSRNTLVMLIIFVISLIVLAHTHFKSIKRSIHLMLENNKLLNDVTESFEKAYAASEAKSSFLANMSHELRTPLNAIIGYSEIIYENVEDDDFKTIPDDAKKITKAGQHLLSLINNVLDLSKVESGKMEVFAEDINFHYLLNEIKEITETLAAKNRNTFIFNVADNLSIIKSDRTKLLQILLNIVGNAVKFTEDGHITVSVTQSANSLNVSIVDTGIGMTKNQLDDLTTPFMQADISTTRKYGGTGLGMNLTEHLAELLGINIQVQSIPNEGTSFELTIPILYKAV